MLGWTKTDSGPKYEKLFFFEGVNLRQDIYILKTHLKHFLRRVELQLDGSYLSLSRHRAGSENPFCSVFFLLREVSIYRDLKTGDILQAWTSIYTGAATEVFEVTDLRKSDYFQSGCERPSECQAQPLRGPARQLCAPHKFHGRLLAGLSKPTPT